MSVQTTTAQTGLKPGFADPVAQSQVVFRQVLEAMSRPGRIETLDLDFEGPASLDLATTAIALALVDFETPLYIAPALSSEETATYLRFHCGAPTTDRAEEASFALLDAVPDDLTAFNEGTDEYPENGATLIIQVDTIAVDGPLTLRGPGIKDRHRLSLPDVADTFWAQRAARQKHFPKGIDLIFVSDRSLCAIPRTTTVSTAQEGE